jgi:ABC-2 type transport system ATP-binding protein
MIKINNLSVSFSEKQVLKDISVNFLPSKIYGIVGLNGAGKTTFFNTLGGLIKPNKGTITWNEKAITHKEIAYLETVNFFYSRITGGEYLDIFEQTNADFNVEILQQYLKLPLDELIEKYSTGMKKKLALLGILKQNRSIFILDEPFNGLDLETNKVLEIIIAQLKEKRKTILVSSHIIDPLLKVCDEILFLENGVFTRTFKKDDFHKIEAEVFGKFKEEAALKIAAAI